MAKADPFTVEQLENINAHIFHLGSLLADDFSLDVVKYLSTKGILAVDAQGYLREVRGEKVYPIDWTDKVEALKYIDILKVNEHEMEVLTGQTDIKQAALQLAEWGWQNRSVAQRMKTESIIFTVIRKLEQKWRVKFCAD